MPKIMNIKAEVNKIIDECARERFEDQAKEKIVAILKSYLGGVYCDTCDGNLEADKCEECHRKYMHWGISDECARTIAEKIIGE